MSLRTTSSQTIGPYLHIGTTWLVTDNLVASGGSGERITIEGRITDGDGAPVNDALIDIWQANAHGKYAHPADTQSKPLEHGFTGFGRVQTDKDGRFRFATVKPGAVPASSGGMQAPHINITIFMRGLMKQLVTRIYFADDPGNAGDEVLSRVPASRRATLIALPTRGEATDFEWNVVLQGEGETVFFEY
jgi:protocatechuate 3,4-dioxygenase alpha subunit